MLAIGGFIILMTLVSDGGVASVSPIAPKRIVATGDGPRQSSGLTPLAESEAQPGSDQRTTALLQPTGTESGVDASQWPQRELALQRYADGVAALVPQRVLTLALRESGARVTQPLGSALSDSLLTGAYQAFTRALGYATRERAENLIFVPKEPDGASAEAVAYRAETAAREVLLALAERFPTLLGEGGATAEIRVLEHVQPIPRALGGWNAMRRGADAAFVMSYPPYELTITIKGEALTGGLRHSWELMLSAMAPR